MGVQRLEALGAPADDLAERRMVLLDDLVEITELSHAVPS
jgi:hypothetical protein